MKGNSNTLETGTSIQPNLTSQTDLALTNAICGSLAIIFPAIVVCAIVGCRKYQAMMVRRQIKYLNRLWQMDSSNNLS
jgi:hypothetical protein